VSYLSQKYETFAYRL